LRRASAEANRTPTRPCELRFRRQSCEHAGENVERAILRGTGQLEGEQYEEATFEGYGPGGVGMLIEVVHQPQPVVGEFRHSMSKNGATWRKRRVGDVSPQGEISVSQERRAKTNCWTSCWKRAPKI